MSSTHQTRTVPQIFDRQLLRLRQRRAALRFADHDFLHKIIAEDIVDRLETVTRDFPSACFLGTGTQRLSNGLTAQCAVGTVDMYDSLAQPTDTPATPVWFSGTEELPARPGSCALIVSMMELHSMNDMPGYLAQVRRALKPDGLFIGALPAENTLQELRDCLYAAETEITGGVSPRVYPFASLRELGGLMQRAGFALPVADTLRLPVTYRAPISLLKDLRYMGETNILRNRKPGTLGRQVLSRALDLYREKFSAGKDGSVTATFEIAVLTGWAPHESQQKPLKPGSAKASLEQAVKTGFKD